MGTSCSQEKDSLNKYKAIISKICDNDELKKNSCVDLTGKDISVDSKVFITIDKEYKYFIFRTDIGKGGDFQGLMFVLGRSFYVGDRVKVYTYLRDSFGYMEVEIYHKINDNWYRISTDYLN